MDKSECGDCVETGARAVHFRLESTDCCGSVNQGREECVGQEPSSPYFGKGLTRFAGKGRTLSNTFFPSGAATT